MQKQGCTEPLASVFSSATTACEERSRVQLATVVICDCWGVFPLFLRFFVCVEVHG